MKKIELLIGDYEYSQIEEIFESEPEFEPITEKDEIIIEAMKQLINKNNLKEENVGGEDTYQTTVKKVSEPENKSLDEGNVEIKL
jgi:hypothetical protein